jgi:hypothetical protein
MRARALDAARRAATERRDYSAIFKRKIVSARAIPRPRDENARTLPGSYRKILSSFSREIGKQRDSPRRGGLMPTLATTVDGLKLPNPFVIGSGPPGTNLNVITRARSLS